MLVGVSPTTRSSIVRRLVSGVTILPSAEGPSLRSDPRWTAERAHRTDRLLGRLVARKRTTARS
jgi:hypothetical protein